MGNIFSQIYHAPDRKARIRAEFDNIRYRLRRLCGLYRPPGSRQFHTVQWQGLTLLLDNTSFVDRWLLERCEWEPAQLAFMQTAIEAVNDPADCVFLDIGAYWGLYGLCAYRAGIRDVQMFEPDPRNRAQLHAQLFLNSLQSDIRVHEFAASDSEGMRVFRPSDAMTDGNRGGAGLTRSDTAGGISVMCKPLDRVLAYRERTIFAKIDVEGGETAVLKGMKDLIENNKIFLQVEVFTENIARTHQQATDLGLRFLGKHHWDAYYSNFDVDLPGLAGEPEDEWGDRNYHGDPENMHH